jgi:hypothetical protein
MMWKKLIILNVSLAVMSLFTHLGLAKDVSRITKEDFNSMMGDPTVVILDVRASRDWNRTDRRIKGAVRENPRLFESWADKYSKDKTLVLYCD